jgi:hypothetical protein
MQISGPETTNRIGDDLMEAAKTRRGTTVSEISRAKTDDMEILSFALTEPKGGIQFPEAIRTKATLLKDSYFGSFKVTHPRSLLLKQFQVGIKNVVSAYLMS